MPDQIFRFNINGYVEVKGANEEEARKKINGCATALDPRGVFVCASPTDLMDILSLDYVSLMYPPIK